MDKLIFKSTANCRELQPTWKDGSVHEVDPIETKRILKDYPDNFEVYDPDVHDPQPDPATADGGGGDGDGGETDDSPNALEDVLTGDDELLNLLLDGGVTTLEEAQQLSFDDIKTMSGANKKQSGLWLKQLAELQPDNDRSEREPDSTK
jgi:hypothetical protein